MCLGLGSQQSGVLIPPNTPNPNQFDDLLEYDSQKLKSAARNIVSVCNSPYTDLDALMTTQRPVDPFMQCTLWEVYSIPRLSPLLRELGGTCRRSYDLRNYWDLKEERFQRTLLQDVSILQPRALLLSPPCTWVSQLQHSNWQRINAVKRVLNLLEALHHIDFSMWLAKLQDDHNRWFIFEHPGQSLAWERESASCLPFGFFNSLKPKLSQPPLS